MKFSSLGTVQSHNMTSCFKGRLDTSVRNRNISGSLQMSSRRALAKSVGQACLVGGFLAASAAHAVTVDPWLFDSAIRILDTNGSNPDTSVQTTSGIIGGERESFIETTGQGFGTVNVTGGEFTFNLDANTSGIGRFVWDGDPVSDVKNDPTNVTTNGLGGVDLTQSCSGGSPSDAFRFQINQASRGDVAITIDVWDMDGDTDSVTVVHPQGAGLAVLEFPFSSFTDVDFDNTAPAVGVGAIRLTIDPAGEDEDTVLQEIGTCPYDFGDARGNAFNGTTGLQVTSELNASENGADGGPRHILQGPILGSVADGESDAQDQSAPPINTAKAVGDDNDGTPNDNDGVTFPAGGMSALNAGDTYTVNVNVSNVATGDAPLLCGWIDFSDLDGSGAFSAPPIGFEDVDNGATDGERKCEVVTAANTNCTDQTGGAFSCNLVFTIPTDWNGGPGVNDGGADSGFLARFRVTNDWASSADSSFNGFASDGEVEDYLISNESLPVSIHSFDSRFNPEGMVLEWGTVSETRNVGFFVWGDTGNGLELLTTEMIPAKAVDPVRPHRYQVTVPGVFNGQVSDLAVTAVDYDGDEEVYGLFEAGQAYGKKVDPAPLAWNQIGSDVRARFAEHAAVAGRHLKAENSAGSKPIAAVRTAGGNASIAAVDVRSSAVGLHEVSWRDLADAGLDLTGVDPAQIAVTLKGEPVARDIAFGAAPEDGAMRRVASLSAAREQGRSPTTFGPGNVIRFWAVKPALPDALYLDAYKYRISVDPALVRQASSENGKPKPGPATALKRLRQDIDAAYNFGSPHADPWYAARLRADRNNVYETTFEVDAALAADESGRIEAVVAGLTDFPENPDHRIQLEVNGEVLADEIFEGQTVVSLDADVPAGLLRVGANTVRLIAPGGTDAPFDISLVDTVTLEYPSALSSTDNRILLEQMEHTGGLTVSGLTTTDTVAYAWDGQNLVRLAREQFSRGSVRVPTIDTGSADYWISSTEAVHRPSEVSAVPETSLLDGVGADLVIIAHPAFMPLSSDEPHPLNDYLAAKRVEGWAPAVFDVQQIQRQAGHGMALPEAVTNFLREASRRFEFEHVLLVGGDSYDYTDNLGLGSISFIPTRYAATRFVPHTPSDNLLADIDGDGVSDKALGRWPVRSIGDLSAIVTKTLDWSADTGALSNAAWVADSQDPGQPSFAEQVERMTQPLFDAGWLEGSVEQILLDEVQPSPGVSVVDAARQAYFDRLESDRSLSGFVGHGAPAMWTFQGLLTPDDIGDLFNEGSPTLIGTLTCYTSYFVSPFSDTVAHRWMNGYRENAAGSRIEGVPNGAVAIHGAATLSNYDQNGWFARQVLERQLAGQTIGQAVLQVRELASPSSDQVINWTLLGDPTVTIQR